MGFLIAPHWFFMAHPDLGPVRLLHTSQQVCVSPASCEAVRVNELSPPAVAGLLWCLAHCTKEGGAGTIKTFTF